MKMKKITTILTVGLMGLTLVYGQNNQQAKLDDGRVVILNENGTWEYISKELKPEPQQEVLPSGECNYATNAVDEFTGNKKLVLKPQRFISYTAEDLKKYFKSGDYILCDVYCAEIANTKLAYFYFKILSKDAYKYFGSIASDSKLTVKFKNGETIILNFCKYDVGDSNYNLGYTTYSSYIVFNDEAIDKLSKNEIDKIRMGWSKGYEDYPVQDSKLFINQLPCIK